MDQPDQAVGLRRRGVQSDRLTSLLERLPRITLLIESSRQLEANRRSALRITLTPGTCNRSGRSRTLKSLGVKTLGRSGRAALPGSRPHCR